MGKRLRWVPALMAVALLLCPKAQAVPINEVYGPFSVTFYNTGDTNGSETGVSDWTAEQMADVGAAIATWDAGLANTPGRLIQLDVFWSEFGPNNTLGGSYSVTNGDGTTSWTYGEHVWRDGANYVGPWTSWDTQIQYDVTAAGFAWNFGADAPAAGEIDFRSVVTHEIGHSIGFYDTYDPTPIYDDWGNTWGTASDPYAWAGYMGLTEWDKHLVDDAGNQPLSGGTGTPGNFNQRDNPVWWTGANANTLYGSQVPIYAPNPYQQGSSLAHLDETRIPNALMSPFISLGQVVREPLPVEWQMMVDMGWTLVSGPQLTTDPPDGGTRTFPLTRVGTTTNADLTATNSGDATLAGTFPSAGGPFGPASTQGFSLGAGESISRTYSYSPLARGADILGVTVVSDGGNSSITLSGQGVGPIYSSTPSPGSTLNFGTIAQGGQAQLLLHIENLTDDPNGGNATLTNLTLNAAIGGVSVSADALGMAADAEFWLPDFAPDTIVQAGGSYNLLILFTATTGDTIGDYSATLTVQTDEGAPYQGSGNAYTYSLAGTVVEAAPIPEPTTLTLVALGGLGLLRRRRRRP